ncbi:TetR/AcrR family transcriptional regulator [Jiella sp. M17.18]|uniref:TetR/AcrR family transcriptional regulator n=1 Tax=Jiella sp. M17.18 TaxID=3234247 RepID=UPI0034DDF0AA
MRTYRMVKRARPQTDSNRRGKKPKRAAVKKRIPRGQRDFAAARAERAETDNPRPRILDAAAALFAERGFAAASIDAVAERLGATKGLVYHHYRSKSDLFADVCAATMAGLEALSLPLAGSRDRAISRLRNLAEAHAGDVLGRIAFHRSFAEAAACNFGAAMAPPDRQALAATIAARADYDARFAAVMAEAAAERDLPSGRDTVMLGRVFVSVLDGPVRWPPEAVAEMAPRFPLVARQLAYFALRGTGASDFALSEEFGH